VLATLAAVAIGASGLLAVTTAAPAQAAAADCSQPQATNSTVMGGFELDGNFCNNANGDDDWSTVGGQPVGNDGLADNTQWTQGAAELGWPWTQAQTQGTGTASSNADVSNVYAYSHVVGDQVYAYFGWERGAVTGSAGFFVELNQKPNRFGPVPDRTTGDLRLLFTQNGNTTLALGGAATWVSSGANSGTWQTLSAGSTVFAGAVNPAGVTNLSGTSVPAGEFAEVGIDLSALFPTGSCSGAFGTMNLRSVANLNAPNPALQDWVSPVSLGVPSTCASVLVNKSWTIDGTTYPNGSQPPGFGADLSLTGQPTPGFGVTYPNRSDGNPYEAGQSVTIGESVTVPTGCTNVAAGDAGAHALSPGLNTFQLTNVVTCTRLTLVKTVVGGTALPVQWTLSADGPTTGVTGPTGSAPVTGVRVIPGSYTLTESGPADHRQTALSCTGGSLTGDTVSVPQGANVVCTFTNTAAYSLVLTKTWVNAAAGDHVDLTIGDGTATASGSSTAPATTTNATLGVLAGDTVHLGETFTTGSAADYATTLSCDNGVTPTPGDSTAGSATVPTALPAGTVITCTFVNARRQASVVLQKTWVDGAAGDRSTLSIGGSNPATAQGPNSTQVSTSLGSPGPDPDTRDLASAPIFAGETIDLSETLARGNTGAYASHFSCDNGVSANGTTATFTVPATPTLVRCIVTNTRTSATVTLQKTWVGAAAGDQADLSISGSDAGTTGSATSTATGAAGSETDTTHRATATVYSGGTVDLGETLSAGNTGSYTSSISCTPGTGFTAGAGGQGGTLNIGAAPVDITCTVVNTRASSALFVLQKRWSNGASGDTADLSVTGGTSNGTATANVPASGTGLSPDTVVVPVDAGQTLDLTEIAGTGNTGTYTSSLACDQPGLIATGADGRSGSYAVTATSGTIVCTFTNTRTSAHVTLRKVWVNGAANDTADLAVGGSDAGTAGAATATATGATGAQTAANTATATIFSGGTVTLSEALGTRNVGRYTSTLSCDNGTTATGTAGGFTVPTPPVDVVCTFTNTRTSSTVTLQKAWVNGATGDTADLAVSGSDPGTAASDRSTASGAAGTETDTAHRATATVFSGETVTVGETLGTGNTGSYTSALSCDNGTSADGTSGSFTVSSTPTPVTCTITNTRTSAALAVLKRWVNGAAGDEAGLAARTTDPTSAQGATATVPAGGTGVSSQVVITTIFSGEHVAVSESLPPTGGSNFGTYTSALACTDGTTGGTSGALVIPAAPGPTICTFTNTRTTTAVELTKSWVNPITGDHVSLTIGDGGRSAVGSSTAPNTTTNATLAVFSGETVTLAEQYLVGNADNYDTTLACDNGVSVTGGSFVVPGTPPTPIVCTFTNTRKHATLTLNKAWVNAVGGDQTALSISGTDAATSGSATATAPASGTGASPQTATATVFVGETVTLGEQLDVNNLASYLAAISCTPAAGFTADADGQGGTLVVGSQPAGSEPPAVSCTVTNTRSQAQAVFEKRWVDGAAGDTATLAISGSDPATAQGAGATRVSTAAGTVGPDLDTRSRAAAPIYAGESVTFTETLGSSDTGTYTSGITCNTGASTPGTSITVTIPTPPVAVSCIATNTRTSATVTLIKEWRGAQAGDQADLSISGSDAGTTGSATSIATGAADQTDSGHAATATIYSGGTVNLGETLPAGNTGAYTSSISCTPGDGFTAGAGGRGGTLTLGAAPVDVTCTVINTRATTALLVVQKSWTNGALGDTANLTATGGNQDGAAAATVPGGGSGLSAATVVVPVDAGQSIDLGEVLPTGDTGTYTSALSCDQSGLTAAADGRSGTFEVPASGAATTVCTFTNTRTSARLTLQKAWVDGAAGDLADLSITGTDAGTAGGNTSTASGAAGTQLDGAHTAAATIFSGGTVTVAEGLGATNVGSYASELSCVSGGTTVATANGTSGGFTVPATPADVTCTFTNTRTEATVQLRKTWDNGAADDTAALSITGTDPATTGAATSTATGATGLEADTTNVAGARVFSGEIVTLGELLGTGNTGGYSSALSCVSGSTTVATATGTSGRFMVPNPPQPVVCTFTNTRTSASLAVLKQWVNGAAGDEVGLAVTGSVPSTDSGTTATVPGNGTGVSNTSVTTTIYSGEHVEVSEDAAPGGHANTGTYASSLACSNGTTGTTTGSFTVPIAPHTEICTFTNTRTSATLTLRKAWHDGAAGDQTTLSVSGSDPGTSGTAVSTATGAAGTETDTTHVAAATIFSGETVDLGEQLSAGNTGAYTSGIACTPTAGFTAGAGGQAGTLVVGASPADVACTVTNTRSATGVLTLQKNWVNGFPGDAADLTAHGLLADGTTTATVPGSGGGISSDKVVIPITAGETLQLGEAVPGGGHSNTGDYTSHLACDQPGLTAAAGGRAGAFTVAAGTSAVTCTFTNTAPAPGLGIVKRVTSNTLNADLSSTVVYDIAVTNTDSVRAAVFTLADRLGFGAGIRIDSATATGQDVDPAWNGVSVTTLVASSTLGAQATTHYTVTVHATVLPGATAADQSCSVGGGFRNTADVSVVAPSARAADPSATACADPIQPPAAIGPPVPIRPPGPLAVTGSDVSLAVLAAGVLLAGGGAVLIAVSRRRRAQ